MPLSIELQLLGRIVFHLISFDLREEEEGLDLLLEYDRWRLVAKIERQDGDR